MRTAMKLLCVALLVAVFPLAIAEEEEGDKQAKKKGKIDATAAEVIETVLGESENAKDLFGKAMGYAVFDNTKVTLGISVCFVMGGAVYKGSGTRTYM